MKSETCVCIDLYLYATLDSRLVKRTILLGLGCEFHETQYHLPWLALRSYVGSILPDGSEKWAMVYPSVLMSAQRSDLIVKTAPAVTTAVII